MVSPLGLSVVGAEFLQVVEEIMGRRSQEKMTGMTYEQRVAQAKLKRPEKVVAERMADLSRLIMAMMRRRFRGR